ncbi:hypothetical protein JOM56_011419 [Amanita muscaria]
MWAKFSSALKTRQSHEDDHSGSQGDVMNRVFEQHPNLSIFQNQNDRSTATPSPPPSPSRNGRRSMFKRSVRVKDDDDSVRAPSPLLKRPQTLPRKMMSHFNLGNGSQTSLLTKESQKLPSADSGSRRPVQEIFSRPPSDPIKHELPSHHPDAYPNPSNILAVAPGFDPGLGSVRSILRHPNTPGTGQNVRFFSRDAYKTISPDSSTSVEPDYQPLPPMEFKGEHGDDLVSLFASESGPVSSSTPATAVAAAVSRSASSSSSNRSRPALFEVFSPLHDEGSVSTDTSKSLDEFGDQPIPAPDFSPLNVSEELQQHLGDEYEVVFSPISQSAPDHVTSTPSDPQDQENDEARLPLESKELPLLPKGVDEKIFHSKESLPRLPNPFHDRSQSFSFGQTVFTAKDNKSPKDSPTAGGSHLISFDPAFSNLDSAVRNSVRSITGRSRALSDTIFHSRAMSPTGHPPEADINDESVTELFSPPPAEPDPFSAHAKTYYTPQTMIPMTPPQKQHYRKTSAEENLIFSLQTQLTLQTELCGQYEADLRARDEMVEMLNNKIAEMDNEENRKKGVLRTWKKKVQELEKSVRYLEEELDGSRQESMERSVMDEASGEALRMLHRQIANLEREKGEWTKKEKSFREEVEVLGDLVKERAEDVTQLKEVLQKRDVSERALQEGIREAKEQIDMLSNVSIAYMDEEELRRLAAEREQHRAVEVERQRAAETNWQQEKTELSMKLESVQLDKGSLAEQLETLREQMKARDEEYAVLKTELEAQWHHMEGASETIQGLKMEKTQLENETVSLKRDLKTLEELSASLEAERQESEAGRNEMENELQEVWNDKEALEREREQLEDQLRQGREEIDELTDALQERQDRISELDQERQFAADSVSRLEENLRRRDQELAEYSIRAVQRETEVEKLREELSGLFRNHSRELDQRTRTVQEALEEAAEARAQLEQGVRLKAELEVENKSNKDRVDALRDELERLRRQVHSLGQDSADKEVKIVQMTKQLSQKEEDMAGLNIALDSKQQELELMKRKQGVRGTAGSTPAQPSKIHRRASSVLEGTPSTSRPPSVLSDSSGRESVLGKQRKRSSESITSSAIKISALGKSSRINGSMGPPITSRPRASISTPTPLARASSVTSQRSTGEKQSATPLTQRRMPSSTFDRVQARTRAAPAVPKGSPGDGSITSVSEAEEKENVGRLPVPA